MVKYINFSGMFEIKSHFSFMAWLVIGFEEKIVMFRW